MGIYRKFFLSASIFIAMPALANSYERSHVYQAFSAYINQDRPIDRKYKLDKNALDDLSAVIRKIKSSSLNSRGNQLNQQFEWWLSRRRNGFVNNENHGPNHGCVGGGNGSRHKSNHKKRKKRGSGGHDDCGGSYN